MRGAVARSPCRLIRAGPVQSGPVDWLVREPGLVQYGRNILPLLSAADRRPEEELMNSSRYPDGVCESEIIYIRTLTSMRGVASAAFIIEAVSGWNGGPYNKGCVLPEDFLM